MIYLDNAATTMQKPDAVYEAVLNAMKTMASVGRSGHRLAYLAAEHVHRCRVAAAQFFNAKPEQVVFTSNATHALNIAIHSLISPGDRVVISGFEHNAVVRPLHHIGARIAVAGRKLFDIRNTLEDFEKQVTSDTKAVICTHVSNVFGYILPVAQIAEICHARGVPLILDASQSAGILPLSMKDLGAAYIAMPGHKGLLGPQGTGILLCGMVPKSLIQGGTGSNSSNPEMPRFLPDCAESGTHNVPGICGLCEGIKFLQDVDTTSIVQHENELLQYACNSLEKKCRVFRGPENTQIGVLSFQISGMDCEEAAEILAHNEVAVRAGLHCASLAHQSAGTHEQGTIRISISSYTETGDLKRFLEIVQKKLIA